ncbi:Hypothetical protein Minf_0630 [Methylacidiphilum infernorum V4]|uniref:Uncharacterized protein n=2 Tax=Candidatus Methylacidiphilum infernorum TaxID=511746 RepID=B3E024_METI4|nr:Hypothetical protein Minf_0630 [Methylacidiphilum infernorum V4]
MGGNESRSELLLDFRKKVCILLAMHFKPILGVVCLLFFLFPGLSFSTLVKTPKGYRLTILPVQGGQELIEKQYVPQGKVTVGELKEVVYGPAKKRKKSLKSKTLSPKSHSPASKR